MRLTRWIAGKSFVYDTVESGDMCQSKHSVTSSTPPVTRNQAVH